MNEEWKDVVGYEGIYQVSNFGNIKRVKTGRLLVQGNKQGYLDVGLHKNGKSRWFYVHRLVAIAFIPNPNNYPQINHKDEMRDNNHVYNLEWCTNKYNCNYGTYLQKLSDRISKPVTQKTLCGEIVKTYKSATQAHEETGISLSYICCCARGEVKTAGGFIWAR